MATIEKATSIKIKSTRDDIEHGSFADSETDYLPAKLVIATFNIRYAVGSYLISGSLLRRMGLKRPRRRPALVSRNIRNTAIGLSNGSLMPRVDIVGLQEADKETKRAGGIHVARELARDLKMHYAHATLGIPRGEEPKSKQWYLDFEEQIASDDAGDTGLAILSRMPLKSTRRIELPWTECRWRPRLALESIIPLGKKNLHLFNAHIDPHATTEEQLEQHKAIIACAENAVGPTVLLGDFNTLTSESRLKMRQLMESHGYTTPFRDRMATWRAGPIRLHPDWIFLRDARVSRFGVTRGLAVSDHWPVWVELEIDDRPEQTS